jgi:putative metallohydrolase (TIGR04338 family)
MELSTRREHVLIHELAHVVTPDECAAHGPEFARAYLQLVGEFLGLEAAAELSGYFKRLGVRVAPESSKSSAP